MTDGPAAGETFAGRYRILAELGTGAMGTVYLAEHLVMGRRTAIKVLRESIARDPEAVARFTRGARNASRVQHPHVCAVYDFGDSEEGLQFLAMEYVDGESLADLIERVGALDVATALELGIQTCAALQAAHDMGIVHRDLKPGNIMLASRVGGGWHAKVVDFDIAKGEEHEGEVTRLGFVIGTPEYMSPEQLIGEPLDGRSDLYSMGIILYRMLTARFPFEAESTQDLMLKRLTEPPLPLARLAPDRPFPTGLQEVLDRALARNREERWATAEEMRRALERAAAGAPARPTPPATPRASAAEATVVVPETMVVQAPRHPDEGGSGRRPVWAVPAGAALLAIAVAGVGWAVFANGEQATPLDDLPRPVVDSGPPDYGNDDPVNDDPVPDTGGGRVVPDDPPRPPVDEDPDPRPALSDGSARQLLDRLMTRIEAPSPSGSTLGAAGDSAESVWTTQSLSDEVRARGAYTRASAELLMGRTEAAREWARRAVRLDPGNAAYSGFLRMIGGDP